MFANLFNLFGRGKTSASRPGSDLRDRNRFRPELESLEDRRLLAVNAFVASSGGNLWIIDDGATPHTGRNVEVRIETTRYSDYSYTDSCIVYVYGRRWDSFAVNQIWGREIRFLGGNAGDTFVNNTYLRCVADGLGGSDRLTGGSNNDVLYGGTGWDQLFGEGGSDTLYSSDAAMGGEDDFDLLVGGYGDDTLHGDAGDDHLFGGFQWGWYENGTNWLFGGGGEDKLVGSYGKDYLFGDGDSDLLDGWDDGIADYLNGGPGADTFEGEHYDSYSYWNGSRVWGIPGNRDRPTDYSSAEGDRTSSDLVVKRYW